MAATKEEASWRRRGAPASTLLPYIVFALGIGDVAVASYEAPATRTAAAPSNHELALQEAMANVEVTVVQVATNDNESTASLEDRRQLASSEGTPWADVCLDERPYIVNELCPQVFKVSTIAFNPNEPQTDAEVTIILRPSTPLGTANVITYVYIKFPTFVALGPTSNRRGYYRQLTVTPNNPVAIGQDPASAYNSDLNPLFENPADFDTRLDPTEEPSTEYEVSQTLILTVRKGYTFQASVDTEVIVCCMTLPLHSPKDDTKYQIAAPTLPPNLGRDIKYEPVKSIPFVDPGYQWDYLQVSFNPPTSKELTQIEVTMRSASDLPCQLPRLLSCRLILHLPGVVYTKAGGAGQDPLSVDFVTPVTSGDGTDWKLFRYKAVWYPVEQKLVFILREGVTLEAMRTVTVQTKFGDFRLPVDIPANSESLQMETRSFDGVDQVIKNTPVYQSSRVPHIRMFKYSRLEYVEEVPGAMTDVKVYLQSNRPMYSGSSIFLRLSGFSANRIEIPIVNETKFHIRGHVGLFNLPDNIIEFKINKTLYCDEEITEIHMQNLILPPALYGNDSSLLVKTSDPGSVWQSIEISPEVAPAHRRRRMVKEFLRSQVLFEPPEPRMPANITFILQPSIVFYQGDLIVLHLYGFQYAGTDVPLLGPSAYRVRDRTAQWVESLSLLALVVEKDEIFPNDEPLNISIGRDTNFRLPDKLSLNDGILRIEGRGAYIIKEPFKKTPFLGAEKFVIDSRLMFAPIEGQVLEDSVARLSFSLIVNTDVLPNSTIFIKLGALTRTVEPSSGDIPLSGANAPMFVGGVGIWDQDANMLTLQLVKEVRIYAGEKIRFFIEQDQYFKLPYAMYPNDPSFRLEIPEAGIRPARKFDFSTRVNIQNKTFTTSLLYYNQLGSLAFPGDGVDCTIKFRSNVDIPGGSIIEFTLPGFTSPVTEISIQPPVNVIGGETYLHHWGIPMPWDQQAFKLFLPVPIGKRAVKGELNVFRILQNEGGFRLPMTKLEENDERLRMAVIENQIIYSEPIKSSPRVVERSFSVSEFEYVPANKEQIFMFKIKFNPTVNVSSSQPVVFSLPGFVNSLSKLNIHITGPDRDMIQSSMGQWNATTSQLTLVPADQIPADHLIDIVIEESQGFILPGALYENDQRLQIESLGNILKRPVIKSPKVGSGPTTSPPHQICMMQHERGTKTLDPICEAAADCDPPLTDPCNAEELERCGCSFLSQELEPIRIQGFNLEASDKLMFIPEEQLCGSSSTSILSSFSMATNVTVTEGGTEVAYYGISSLDTGYFRMCVTHQGQVYDVGQATVRPSCKKSYVMVDGVCVQHCPKTKVPTAGACLRDPVAGEEWDMQALMLPVRMTDPNVAKSVLADSNTDDPERRYFVYRYTYELAKLLNCDPTRIEVASLSNGSLIVNTIFKPVMSDGEAVTTGERSPMGLISLLQALQRDSSSQLYTSSFFKQMDRVYKQEPLFVRECTSDGVYRIFCPYTGEISSSGTAYALFFTFLVIDALLTLCIGACAWQMDTGGKDKIDEDILEKVREDPKKVSAPYQVEYARSWMQGRFMGEEWEAARKRRLIPIGNAPDVGTDLALAKH